MRICVFSERLAEPFDEGIKGYAWHLIRELRKAHDVLALTIFGRSSPEAGIRNVWGNKLLLSVPLARQVRRFRPELILYVPTACATPFSFWRARLLKLYGAGAPVVLVALQVRRYGWIAQRVMPHLRPDLVLVQAERTRASLAPLGCRLRLIPPGVDWERFRPATPERRARLRQAYGIDPQSYVLLHVGHLNRGRNVQALLPLQRPGQQVVVVGSTSTPQDEELVEELLRAGVKVIRGYVRDIAELYQLADCYVFPVKGETSAIDLPLSVLEAMACDLPVVSMPFGGLATQIQGESRAQLEAGQGLVYVEDGSQLAEAVEACKRLARAGTREMVAPFAWPKVIPAILEGICADLGLARPGAAGG